MFSCSENVLIYTSTTLVPAIISCNALLSLLTKNTIKLIIINDKVIGVIYPKYKDIFKAFKLCNIDDVKVVIIGQDPYHGENEATGLAFSVEDNIKTPPSLRNIFIELNDDLKII